MATTISIRTPASCLRAFLAESRPQRVLFKRSLVTVQRGPSTKLDLPANLPQQYWSQLPPRLRPDHAAREIVVHRAPPSEKQACKDPVSVIDKAQLALLDPSGARSRLFDPLNRDGAKVGDVLLTTFKSGEPFSGVILSIKQRGPSTSVLLRNQLTRIGLEMQIKVFSPLVQSMEIAQKAQRKVRRARLYYMRKPKHDIGSVQKIVDQYTRQRALLTGSKGGSSTTRSGRRGPPRR